MVGGHRLPCSSVHHRLDSSAFGVEEHDADAVLSECRSDLFDVLGLRRREDSGYTAGVAAADQGLEQATLPIVELQLEGPEVRLGDEIEVNDAQGVGSIGTDRPNTFQGLDDAPSPSRRPSPSPGTASGTRSM